MSKKPTPKKKVSKASIKQRKAFKNAVENGGKIGKALRDAGFSESIVSNPSRVTKTEGWQELLAEAGLDDKTIAAGHKQLMDQKKLEYFVFPTAMKDEEIVGHVEGAGLKVIVIRKSQMGKLAFYSIADANAKKAALEMAYKIRGAFGNGGDGSLVVPIQINNMLGSKRESYGI